MQAHTHTNQQEQILKVEGTETPTEQEHKLVSKASNETDCTDTASLNGDEIKLPPTEGENKKRTLDREESTSPRVKKLKAASSSAASIRSTISCVSVGKCPPRDMKRLKRGVKYVVTRVAKWGEKLALFLKNPNDEKDSGFFKPPESYKNASFRVGDKITLEGVGYSASRNRIAQTIGIDSSESMCKQFCENNFGPEGGCCSLSVLSPMMEKARQLDAAHINGSMGLDRKLSHNPAQEQLSSLMNMEQSAIQGMLPKYAGLFGQSQEQPQQLYNIGGFLPSSNDKLQPMMPSFNSLTKQAIDQQLEIAQQVQLSLQQQTMKQLFEQQQQQQFMVFPQLFNLSRPQQPVQTSPFNSFNQAVLVSQNNPNMPPGST
uniref:Uncharacterized protein n=1 Tax=Mucochytrium quahogii TaxID=96639 RepID=A0A7S2RIS5_9STRA|mmetsp:Transcript_29743/g.47387  ORF Transcript_29743/g.47387 Transcript_29743/m.47387 type:complete len:374 (-) Transcript_29743:48-1169(-)